MSGEMAHEVPGPSWAHILSDYNQTMESDQVIRELRARLELDSGYLSRLIQALTGKGLVGGWRRRPEAWDWVVVYWLRWRLKHEHSDSARCSWRPTRRSSKQ